MPRICPKCGTEMIYVGEKEDEDWTFPNFDESYFADRRGYDYKCPKCGQTEY